ncbi:MAG TPA: prepilin peptidase [Acetobacteraceae bacterium]|nr:prepilin peptidase [Acetobacteraceae bacterium]
MMAGLCDVAGIVLLAYAAAHDLVARTVPNWTSFAIVLVALPIRIAERDMAGAVAFSLFIFAVLALLWRLRMLGGGDVKLWAASSLLLQPSWSAEILSFYRVLLMGGVLAVLYLMMRGFCRGRNLKLAGTAGRALWKRAAHAELWRIRQGGSLPYAVAISAGMAIALWP